MTFDSDRFMQGPLSMFPFMQPTASGRGSSQPHPERRQRGDNDDDFVGDGEFDDGGSDVQGGGDDDIVEFASTSSCGGSEDRSADELGTCNEDDVDEMIEMMDNDEDVGHDGRRHGDVCHPPASSANKAVIVGQQVKVVDRHRGMARGGATVGPVSGNGNIEMMASLA